MREAEAEQVKINASRDVLLRRAETETQTAAAQARAAQSGPLAEAEATQEVTRKQTELAELEAGRKQKELLTSVVRPAEADAEAQIRRAEGEKGARIAQAQADAERVKLAGSAEAAVTITKGEAQARVVQVNATAEAQRTTLEGNAEAGIVFTKGGAEAKALALRAEAYRQFNEAAIIQTVLSMLPEIVRAAAEPLANIDHLTVLSNDGASDVVKTVTRTVAEANATVKGLTGIDIPVLVSDAMGGGATGGEGDLPQRKGGPGGTRGGGPTSGGGTTRSAPRGTSGSGDTGPARSAPSAPTASAPAAGAGAEPSGQVGNVTAAAAATEAVDAALAAADRAIRAATTTPVVRTDTAAGSATPARPGTLPPRPASAGITRETALDDAALRLAADLRAVPGIERFATIRLADLETAGPRPLRTMWRISREQLDRRYGQLTIGELIDRARNVPGAPS